jgi:hypothetical protein
MQIEDFDLLKVIGKGSFGKARVAPPAPLAYMHTHMQAHTCRRRTWPRAYHVRECAGAGDAGAQARYPPYLCDEDHPQGKGNGVHTHPTATA